MPSKSQAQHNLMEGVAHNPKFAQKVGVPQKVGKDFVSADQRKAMANAIRSRKAPQAPPGSEPDADDY